jgi:hypothetical protein
LFRQHVAGVLQVFLSGGNTTAAACCLRFSAFVEALDVRKRAPNTQTFALGLRRQMHLCC